MDKHTNTIAALTRNLEDTLDISSIFIKVLQEEMVVNASFRGKIEQTILNIQDKLSQLSDIATEESDKSNSLINKVDKLEFMVNELEKEIIVVKNEKDKLSDENKQETVKKRERFWNFIIQNSTVILAWTGPALWVVFEFLRKKFDF